MIVREADERAAIGGRRRRGAVRVDDGVKVREDRGIGRSFGQLMVHHDAVESDRLRIGENSDAAEVELGDAAEVGT